MLNMTFNIIYMFVIVIGIYYGTTVYIRTRKQFTLWFLGVLIFSLGLEIRRLNLGNYITDLTDTFRTIRDIVRTILVII